MVVISGDGELLSFAGEMLPVRTELRRSPSPLIPTTKDGQNHQILVILKSKITTFG